LETGRRRFQKAAKISLLASATPPIAGLICEITAKQRPQAFIYEGQEGRDLTSPIWGPRVSQGTRPSAARLLKPRAAGRDLAHTSGTNNGRGAWWSDNSHRASHSFVGRSPTKRAGGGLLRALGRPARVGSLVGETSATSARKVFRPIRHGKWGGGYSQADRGRRFRGARS